MNTSNDQAKSRADSMPAAFYLKRAFLIFMIFGAIGLDGLGIWSCGHDLGSGFARLGGLVVVTVLAFQIRWCGRTWEALNREYGRATTD